MESIRQPAMNGVVLTPPAANKSDMTKTRPTSSIIEWVIVGCYAYFCSIILAEVVMRYFFGYSTTWGEMTARYAHVYFAYLAAAEAFRHDTHIRVDFLPKYLHGKARLLLELYIDALCIGVAAAVCYYSFDVVRLQVSAGFQMQELPLNMAFATAAVPIGWSLMIIRIVQRLVRRFQTGGVYPELKRSE